MVLHKPICINIDIYQIYIYIFYFSRDNATSGRVSRQGMESHALTAANLIDAIITHQINQSNDGSGHPPNATPINSQAHVQQQRAVDKLFQVSSSIRFILNLCVIKLFIFTSYLFLFYLTNMLCFLGIPRS